MRILIVLLWLSQAANAFHNGRTVPVRPSLFASEFDAQSQSATAAEAAAVDDNKHAIIVGGGPVGLAAALTLSNAPHYYHVTLLEQSTGTGLFDPTKAYLYNINQRGQEWTRQFPAVQALLEERGSSTGMGGIVIVPADPKEPIPKKKDIAVSLSKGDESFWIPRHTMTVLLEEVIMKQEGNRKEGTLNVGKIELLYSKQCESIQAKHGQVEVTVQDTVDPNIRFREKYTGNLLIGADGVNSAVRNCLADETATSTTWLNSTPKQFRVKAWKSPSTDLRMKILQFPPAFEIPNVGGNTLTTTSEGIYAIRSTFKGPRNYISLGLLPIKNSTMMRPTNVITRPNHEIWSLKNGKEVKEWFTRAFPRLPLNSMIPDEEWDRFSMAKGTTFPHCQYCPKLQLSHPSGHAGVALIGDSIHAFPPDIGQGINAGLGDVVALDRAMQGKDITTGEEMEQKPATLGKALKEYERVRGPDIRALIRLARFGSPYQYRQPLRKDKIGRFLWMINITARMMLNKLSRGLVPMPAIMLAGGNKLTFQEVMRQADLTTVSLSALIFFLGWKICLSKLVGKIV